MLAGTMGFEPMTYCVTGSRALQAAPRPLKKILKKIFPYFNAFQNLLYHDSDILPPAPKLFRFQTYFVLRDNSLTSEGEDLILSYLILSYPSPTYILPLPEGGGGFGRSILPLEEGED